MNEIAKTFKKRQKSKVKHYFAKVSIMTESQPSLSLRLCPVYFCELGLLNVLRMRQTWMDYRTGAQEPNRSGGPGPLYDVVQLRDTERPQRDKNDQ